MKKLQHATVVIAAVTTLMIGLLDTNIATSAAASIARSFGDNALTRLPWLLTVYALAETIAQPLYGKLADRFGVKRLLLVALALFTIGSLLCGFATSMPMLIDFRVLQGLGAAGLLSITFVLIGHLRATAEEETSSGGNAMAGVMLSLGMIGGPLLGGTIINHIGWRWIFWINVPIGAVVLLLFSICLKPTAEKRSGAIDWVAAGALAASAAAVQLVCIWGGQTYAWRSWPIIGTSTAGLVALVLFIWRQLRFREPFFPPYLLTHRTLRRLTLLQLATGVGLAAASVYITLSFQMIRGYSPFDAGLQLIPMAIGVSAGAIVGSIVLKAGKQLRNSLIIGTGLAAAALAGLALTAVSAPVFLLQLVVAVLGIGIGVGIGNELILIQSAVDLKDLGTATAGVRFVETLGTSAGATAFGFVFSHAIGSAAATVAIGNALQLVFWIGAAVMVLATVMACRLPRHMTTKQTPPLG